MYDHLTSQMYNFKSLETMYAEMQAQSERDKLNANRDLVTKCTNVYNPLQFCKEEVEVEPVKKPKSPFEIRIDLWNTLTKEIHRWKNSCAKLLRGNTGADFSEYPVLRRTEKGSR